MKKVMGLFLAIGVLILGSCDNTAALDGADKIEDIVGTWQRIGGTSDNFCRNDEDGTYLCADSVEALDDNSGFRGDFWFEDGRFHDQTRAACQEIGIYEVSFLDSGNLKYELIEDECSGRVSNLFGAFDTEGKIEWALVQ